MPPTPHQTHRALILHEFGQPLTLSTVPTPPPSPGTVILRILGSLLPPYTGAVLSGDRARAYPLPLPCVPGTGAIARVHAVSADTTALAVGRLVFADCHTRARDDDGLALLIGWHTGGTVAGQRLAAEVWRDGSFAEVAAWPLENVVVLDEGALMGVEMTGGLGYSVAELAGGLSGLMVPYGGLVEAGVGAGDAVVVAPATGTFGGFAVAVALAMGARVVVAVGRSGEKLAELRKRHGARRIRTVQLSGGVEEDAQAVAAAAGGKGADVYQDWSPPGAGADGTSPSHIESCIKALRPGGTASLMGGITGNVSIPYGVVMHKNLRVLGRFMYEKKQAEQLVKLVESGLLELGERAGRRVRGQFGLEEWEKALSVAAEDKGGVVLTP
ncbi:NAD(P)-binding protein [Saccharata proteae CBS 121410]|uniref:NAD(P)-binding protein n=1 Tax=Saccharata proteae CBS 121410 TaxID=1314787 RepID=A0A9P4I1V4_9PEZI|nr:NAD(P)-binding protein [Saccharata proteae CBS 121410]